MRPNYVDLRKCDTVVTMNVEEMTAEIDFARIRDLYLTPMEALIYSILRKYAGDSEDGRKFLKIAHSDLLRVFSFMDGNDKLIEVTFNKLIEKRLIIEAQDMSQLFGRTEDGEFFYLYHCL